MGFQVGRGESAPTFMYRYPVGMRYLAKVMLPLSAAWAAWELYDNAPNIARPDSTIWAYVCCSSGEAVPAGSRVELLDDFSETVSSTQGTVDDWGLVVVDIDAWAKRPSSARVFAGDSAPETVPIARGPHGRCPRSESLHPQETSGLLVEVSCRRESH